MRKSICLLFCSLLLSCLFTNLYSQSEENELDQFELMKQFIGDWAAEAGKDSTWLWTVAPPSPYNEYVQSFALQVKGKNVETSLGMIQFGSEYKTTKSTILHPDESVTLDIGGFVSDKKYIAERFYPEDMKTVLGTWECTFLTPDKFTATWKIEGVKIREYIYIRVKE